MLSNDSTTSYLSSRIASLKRFKFEKIRLLYIITMSREMSTGSNNLAGDLINEMKQTNPPGAVDFGDTHGSPLQPFPSQGPGSI